MYLPFDAAPTARLADFVLQRRTNVIDLERCRVCCQDPGRSVIACAHENMPQRGDVR
jgi:hypothetical protein